MLKVNFWNILVLSHLEFWKKRVAKKYPDNALWLLRNERMIKFLKE